MAISHSNSSKQLWNSMSLSTTRDGSRDRSNSDCSADESTPFLSTDGTHNDTLYDSTNDNNNLCGFNISNSSIMTIRDQNGGNTHLENTAFTQSRKTYRTLRRRHSRCSWVILKLCSYCLIGAVFMALFRLVFLPRTSLSRDLRWLHSDKLTKPDLFRLFLELDSPNFYDSDAKSEETNDIVLIKSLIRKCTSLKCQDSDILTLLKCHYEPFIHGKGEIHLDENSLVLTFSGTSSSKNENEKVIIGTDVSNTSFHSLKMVDSIISKFAKLKSLGWKPLRDITFVIWRVSNQDKYINKEYLIEKFHFGRTSSTVIAYIELSTVMGSTWESDLLLNDIIYSTSKMLLYNENNNYSNTTLYQNWFGNHSQFKTMPIKKQKSKFERWFSIPSIKISTTLANDIDEYDRILKFLGYLILNIAEREVVSYDIYTLSSEIIKYLTKVYDRLIQNSDSIDLQLILDYRIFKKLLGSEYHKYQSISRKYEGLTILKFLEDSMTLLNSSNVKISQINDELKKYQNEDLIEDIPWFSYYKKMRLLFRIKYVNIMLRNVNKLFQIFDADKNESVFYLYSDNDETDNKILIPKLEYALQEKDVYQCIKLVVITIFNLDELSKI